MSPLPPSHLQLLLLSTFLYGMGYPSGQLGSATLSLSLPLLSNACGEEWKAENGMWGFLSDSWDFSVLSGLLSTTPLSANRQVKRNLLQDLHTWAYWSMIHSTECPSPEVFSCSRRDQEPGERVQVTRELVQFTVAMCLALDLDSHTCKLTILFPDQAYQNLTEQTSGTSWKYLKSVAAHIRPSTWPTAAWSPHQHSCVNLNLE